MMFPFDIHSDTIANSVSVILTPRSGNTFGCRRAFHDTNSLENLCSLWSVLGGYVGNGRHWRPTRVIISRLLVAYVLNTLTATSRPWYVRFHTSPNPPRYRKTPGESSNNSIFSDRGTRTWRAHIVRRNFTHFPRICGARSTVSNA